MTSKERTEQMSTEQLKKELAELQCMSLPIYSPDNAKGFGIAFGIRTRRKRHAMAGEIARRRKVEDTNGQAD